MTTLQSGRLPLGAVLLGPDHTPAPRAWTLEIGVDEATLAAYRRIRHEVFVQEQGLFDATDADEFDDHPDLHCLVARAADGTVLGGVRIAPVTADTGLGWWRGSRLAVRRAARREGGLGAALVRAACSHAEQLGALRFEASVQLAAQPMFTRMGWRPLDSATLAGLEHRRMRWPIGRLAALAASTKAPLGGLLGGLHLGGAGFVGDDGAPVPGTDVVAACDAILPSLVERDPEWAGWCGVLVNVNDLSAMGARPVGLLDAVGARDVSFASRVLTGLRGASEAYRIPVLGGHSQFGVPASLTVTALGRTRHPIAASGGRAGQQLRLTADLGGGWRPGHRGRQWDSTSARDAAELAAMQRFVGAQRPAAAKDVSMAGLAGTAGMLAEASGTGAVLDVGAVPRPVQAGAADWFSCFPGFAMLTADDAGRPAAPSGPAVTAACGELITEPGVWLRWPDGELTEAIAGAVTGLGPTGIRDGSRRMS